MMCATEQKGKIVDLKREGHKSHRFCKKCLKNYQAQASHNAILEPPKKSYTVRCPVRRCGEICELIELANEVYGPSQLEKYGKTAVLEEKPFKLSFVPVSNVGKKDDIHCYVEGCKENSDYFKKSDKCRRTCGFFICSKHAKEGAAILKANSRKCPGCGEGNYKINDIRMLDSGDIDVIKGPMKIAE